MKKGEKLTSVSGEEKQQQKRIKSAGIVTKNDIRRIQLRRVGATFFKVV